MDYVAVEELGFDEETAKALERVYRTRDVKRRRRLVQEALDVQPRERVLDVGCGPGFYLAEILEQVGDEGSVTGVDLSSAMLAIARNRVGDAPNVSLAEAQATDLPFDDGSFDAAVCVQVLEFVADVPAALAELHRVLRPGGRVVLWDVDWATVSMQARDTDRLERVLAAWDRHLVHPSLPRTLPTLLREADFEDVSLEGHSFTTAELTFEAYGGSLIGMIENYLTNLPDFPDDEAQAWAEEQRALGAAGEFYFAVVQCCVSGCRG